MNSEKMGQFIAESRKLKHMTQKDLAEKLNITDKEVSKWERGLSCPDISLLSSIADILGVSTSELLNGEKNNSYSGDSQVSIYNALQYTDKTVEGKAKSIHNIFAMAFSLLLLLGMIVCTICDLTISGNLTWSLFPISSAIFTWIVFFPVIKFGKKGILSTVIALSVLIVPFLYVMNHLIKSNDLIMPVGIRMSIISIVFLWLVFVLFNKLKAQKLIATAISLLLAIPVCIVINITLSGIIGGPIFDVWDVLVFSIIIFTVISLFAIDFNVRKKKSVSNNS